MIKYLTKENIALAISVTSISISLYNFLKNEWNDRTNFSIDLKSYIPINLKEKDILYLEIAFINKSKLPISIHSIQIEFKNKIQYFSGNKVKIYSENIRQGKETIYRNEYHSIELPQTIPSLGSLRGHFHIDLIDVPLEKLLDEPLNLVVNTNRKSKSFDVTINQELSERWQL